ncbi:hypothetical protein D9Q98_008807 [Chlorella vulgaris]|uniref:Uncharacterized protein n=1 Tax=Chlorella vulgaris TaxID=3077 RepID=A0A9D4TIN2_CHLVU|nr:hypothetical protein D9Q98_008807 [Chlorella vulgaris]
MESTIKIPLQREMAPLAEDGGDSAATAQPAPAAGKWRTRLARAKSFVRPYLVDEDEEEVGNGEPMNGGVNPLIQTYVMPGDLRSKPRYFLTVAVVVAGCMWWMGPMIGVFVVDPMIQLTLSNFQVITSKTDCFDHRMDHQVCEDSGVKANYYFYNITNVDQWIAGTEPPAYVEVGPYAFATSEVRYDMKYDKDWNQVSYSYHTIETFDRGLSCPTCTLDDSLTVVNRGYQQFYAAMRRMAAALSGPGSDSVLPEEQVKVIIMPLTLLDISARLYGAAAFLGSANPAADALSQWVNCGLMRTLTADTDFFLPTNASDPQGLTYPPELCHYIAHTLAAVTSSPDPFISPALFATYGLDIPLGAAGAWLTAAIGSSSPAGPDPAAQAFVTRFLLLSRDTNLAYLASADPTLHAALLPITADQWNMLKGYLASLLGTYSTGTYSLFMAFGGAQLIAAEVQRVASRWMAMAAPTPEQAFVYTLMPLAVRTMVDAVTYNAMLPQVEAGIRADPSLTGYPADQPLPPNLQAMALATAQQLTVDQWATCGVLGGYPLPVGPGGFPYAPEFCAFLVANAESLGFNFAVTPSMFADLGLAIPTPAATAFLDAVAGTSTATSSDPFAMSVIQTFMMSPDKASALGWLGAQGGDSAARAAAMSSLTDLQFKGLQLYLISLLPTWGKLVYTTWLHQGQSGPGAAGLVVTRPVQQLLYGYEDPVLLTSAQMSNPQHYRLAPYFYTVFNALSFPTQEWPVEYFSNVTGTSYNYSQLSYKVTDIGAFHPLIQQKTLLTGKREGDWPQSTVLYRGIPFAPKPLGLLNVTGINEGVVQGSNFKPGVEPIQYESAIVRPVKTVSTGSHIRVKKVKAYQMTLHPESGAECNQTRFAEWKAATGFDEQAFQATMAALAALKQDNPVAYWDLIQDDSALSAYLNTTDLGLLNKYFNKEQGAWLLRCANPEHAPYTWDFSDTYTCPTLGTLPRFYKSSEEVIASSGTTDWNASYGNHGWYFAVEPITGMAIQGHKGYMFSQLVQRTDVAYPDLWVANGSKDSALGRGMGMDGDFVTVPLSTVLLRWEPTKLAATALRAVALAKEVLYWTLVVGFPVVGWLVLFPVLIYLKFSKSAKLRGRELHKLQKSTAKRVRLGRHETAMAEALWRVGNGSKSVFVPPARDLSASSEDEADSQRNSELSVATGPPGGPKGSQRRGSRLSAFEAKSAAAATAAAATSARSPQSPAAAAGGSELDSFVIGTAPQAGAGWSGTTTSNAGQAGPSQPAKLEGSVAVTLLPPGEMSAAVPTSFRRSTGGGGTSGLRKRTTSTQEGP